MGNKLLQFIIFISIESNLLVQMVVVIYNLMIDTLTFSILFFTDITEHKMTKTKILNNLGLAFLFILLLLRFF